MPNQDEPIDTQSSTSTPDASEGVQQTQESSAPGQSVQTEDAGIPEKFAGKSAADIAQAYRELEKDRGRLATDLGSARKEREDMEKRFRDLELAVSRYNTMPTQVPPVQRQPDPDPFAALDQGFADDPQKAIKEAFKAQQELLTRRSQEQSMQQRAADAQNFYWEQKKSNQDYARREPIMQQLAQEFQDMIRPEYMNSKKVLEALDLMSRGRDLDFYVKQAAESGQRNGSSVRQEKLRAQSDSATSSGSKSHKDPSKMSAKELASLLSRSDD